MSTVTIIIHTYNEESNIDQCIDSAKLLSEKIIVIDMYSQDKTVAIAKKAGTQTVLFPFSYIVEPARSFGIEQAQSEWVLILDADERITPELVEEFKNTISSTDKTYFKIPRKNIFGRKKWLQHGGWSPDMQIRLIKKEAFVEWPKQIHSTPVIKGEMGIFHQPLLHYFHGDLEKMVQKTALFEDIESDLLFRAGKKVAIITFFRKFLGELFRRLIKNKAYLDGKIGIMEAIYQAYSKTITYLFLYEKKKSGSL